MKLNIFIAIFFILIHLNTTLPVFSYGSSICLFVCHVFVTGYNTRIFRYLNCKRIKQPKFLIDGSARLTNGSKKKSKLISKGMCVLLLDVFNRCFLVQQKNWRFQNFDIFGKKIRRNALDLKSKKINVYFGIIVFSCLRFLLICFAWEIKGFYQSCLGNDLDFTDIMNSFLKYLG